MPIRSFSFCLIVLACAASIPVRIVAQRREKVLHKPQIKPDMLTLRYKPQAGTLLYTIHTRIGQSVHAGAEHETAMLESNAELAFQNVAIDYKKGLWSFDEYFTNFEIAGKNFSGDSLSLHENFAINRVTRLTFDMRGNELERVVQDSLKLLNAEAQTNAYFFEPPRMLIPLPEHGVTYGNTWEEHSRDTIPVYDTVNVGVTSGSYIYDVSRTYRLVSLIDTMQSYLVIIVGRDTGTFQGFQTNTVTKVTTNSYGPISGVDTTILDLASGSVVKRALDMTIPARVQVSSAEPFLDELNVRSVVRLSEANAKFIGD